MLAGKEAPIGATRLFAKLTLVLIPCFLCASSFGFFWLAEHDLRHEHDGLATRIGNAAARVTSGLERHGASSTAAAIWQEPLPQELLTMLLADQAVRCVELRAGDTGEIRLAAPIGLGCTGQEFDASLEVPFFAEGIEAAVTSRILQESGVRLGQGYLCSPPMPPVAFRDWYVCYTDKGGPASRRRASADLLFELLEDGV